MALTPVCVTRETVPPDMLDKEREILTELARKSGKAEQFIAKMVEGRMGKFYEDKVLLDQKFIMDEKKSVQEILADASSRVGQKLKIADFVYLKVGEGL